MSGVMCQVSCVSCKVSVVTCHFFLFLSDKVVGLVGGGPVISGAYPSSYYIHVNKSRSFRKMLVHARVFTETLILIITSDRSSIH